MSMNGPIRDNAPPDEERAGRPEPESEAQAGELSFEDLPLAKPRRPDETPFVHKLQERVQAALQEPEHESAAATEAEVENIKRWPLQVQVLCIMGGSALCWGVILAPFVLF